MQLHYNIIWIDDEVNKFEEVGDVDRIKEFLKDLGFNPSILTLKEGKGIERHFEGKNFDLILSDFSIEEGHHGDDIIKVIRGHNIYTEVLFYTSQENELENIAKKLLKVDRISFHSGRRGLIPKVEMLIKLSVAKLLELNATRGLITAETSELDVTMETIVMNFVFEKLNLNGSQQNDIMNSYVEGFLRKSPDYFLKKYSELGFKNWFHRIESKRKWLIFRDLISRNSTPEVQDFLKLNKAYYDDVIAIRNQFAHAKAIEKDNKLYLAGLGPDGASFCFEEAECITIRKKLIVHRESFDILLNHLKMDVN